MTKPMRRALLRDQISIEARRIAHDATKTCRWRGLRFIEETEPPTEDAHHTPACNKLKHAIEALVLTVRLAEVQPSARPAPPDFALEQQEADG